MMSDESSCSGSRIVSAVVSSELSKVAEKSAGHARHLKISLIGPRCAIGKTLKGWLV